MTEIEESAGRNLPAVFFCLESKKNACYNEIGSDIYVIGSSMPPQIVQSNPNYLPKETDNDQNLLLNRKKIDRFALSSLILCFLLSPLTVFWTQEETWRHSDIFVDFPQALWSLFVFITWYGAWMYIPAIILGIISLKRISKQSSELKGKILAVFGIILGTIGFLLTEFWQMVFSQNVGY